MFGMNKRPRGLFGAPTTFPGTPGIGDEIDPTRMGVPGLGMQHPEAMPARKPGIGTKLFGQGWEDKAFAIGGILQGDGGAAYNEMQKRKMAPLLEQAQREAEFADWQRKEQWKRDNPMPSNAQPYRFEDNAGNVWEVGPTGEPKRIFTDMVDKVYVQGDQAVHIPNPFRTGNGAPAATGPKVGEIVNGHRFKGGNPNDPASWEATGGAAGPASRPFSASIPDPLKGPGTVTSMRRTAQGNRLVGGVPNSRHLTGEAVDVVGTDRDSLRKYYGPNANVGWHKNHWHVEVPGAKFDYYGRRGTTGLRGR